MNIHDPKQVIEMMCLLTHDALETEAGDMAIGAADRWGRSTD